MNDFVEKPMSYQLKVYDGTVADFDLLPVELDMLPRPDQDLNDGLQIELSPLKFDYSTVKQEVAEGRSRLRLLKDEKGSLLGFTVVSPGEVESNIGMLWVNPQYRNIALGEKLLADAVNVLPSSTISMDIWGGLPMINLATKLGFSQKAGRYSLQKK